MMHVLATGGDHMIQVVGTYSVLLNVSHNVYSGDHMMPE